MSKPRIPETYSKVCDELQRKPRRWLVTGAAGFIGSALSERLLELGQEVVGLDNFSSGHRENLQYAMASAGKGAAERFRFVEGDICDAPVSSQVCERIDYVLHQAALGSVPRSIEDPIGSHRANVDGFLQIVMAARSAGVKRVVYASSSSVYGDHPALPKVEHVIGKALSPYAATKQIDEIYAAVVQLTYGLELTGLRYFNVFGRRQDPNGPYAAVIPRWYGQLLKGEGCVIYGDGSQSRDFCYVDNAVQANLLAALAPAHTTNQIYNVGCGERTDLNQLFEMMRELAAAYSPLAARVRAEHASPRPGDVPHSHADITMIREAFGYVPTHDVRTGLAETARWFAAPFHHSPMPGSRLGSQHG
jgi:UDP-N-acetylglucosamine 4-epimerase